jgi:two-component system, LytTR family, response regulator
MIDAIIVDDEKNNIDNIHSIIRRYCPNINIVDSALNAVEAKNIIQSKKPALIFLDIQMPGQTGIELLNELQPLNFEVIFITAYDQYAIQAFKFSAVDYLLKPVDKDAFITAISRAVARIESKQQNTHLNHLLQVLKQQNKAEHRIALSTLKETRFVFAREIIYCESSNNYTTVYLESGEHLLVSKPIFEFEELLTDYGFVRCHQSYLVNIQFVKSLRKVDGDSLLLHNEIELPLARSKKEAVKKALNS